MSQRELFTVHVPAAVLEELEAALGYFRSHGLPFTAESLRDRCSYTTRQILALPEHINVLGGFLRGRAARRTIVPDGFVEAQRESARGRALRRWKVA